MFVLILILLLVCDFLWFQYSLDAVYKPVLGDFTMRYAGAIAWVFIAWGLSKYVLPNAKDNYDAALQGAIFGLIVYGVYNGTNYATISTWTPKVWLIDNLWGAFVCGLVSYITFLITRA